MVKRQGMVKYVSQHIFSTSSIKGQNIESGASGCLESSILEENKEVSRQVIAEKHWII